MIIFQRPREGYQALALINQGILIHVFLKLLNDFNLLLLLSYSADFEADDDINKSETDSTVNLRVR